MTTTSTARTTPPGARRRPRTGVIAVVFTLAVWAAAATVSLVFARGDLVASSTSLPATRP